MKKNFTLDADGDDLEKNFENYEIKQLKEARGDSLDDLMKFAQGNTNAQQRPTTQAKQKRTRDPASFAEDDENLGEDFENTPWIPPTIEKAKEFRRHALFRSGDVRLDSVDIVHAPDLGSGVTLYFQFAMTMAICLFVMSLLSLPALIFNYNGSAIPEEDQDGLGLYKYTLGNIGYNREDPLYKSLSDCKSGLYAKNETCLHINGNEISLSQAGSVLTAMEFLQCIVFMIGVFHMYRRTMSVTGRSAKSETAISDYSIMVTNLPSDASDKEIIQHFSNLYALDKQDFRHRPVVEGAEAVTDNSNTNDAMYLDTWIAECVVHKAVGGFISSFKNKQHIMERLYRNRATMKMYAENSPHADGHNLTKYMHAENNMIATGAMIDKMTEKNIRGSGLNFLTLEDFKNKPEKVTVHNPQSIYYNIDASSTAAFVCFQYNESFARCLKDYTRYSTFPMSLVYPPLLKFRGTHKIHVIKAPEPDQILWENLEISPEYKSFLRFRTGLITVALIIVCFIIILQASIYKTYFANQVPSRSLCNQIVPQLYTNDGNLRSIDYTAISFMRPPNSLQATLDQECESIIPNSFNVQLSQYDSYNKSLARYDYAACYNQTTSEAVFCPAYGSKTYCPCVTTQSSVQCGSYICQDHPDSLSCQYFKAGTLGSCYCYESLGNILSSQGATYAINTLNSLRTSNCGSFFSQYSVASALTYVSVVTTTIVNVLMRIFLKNLAKQEAANSSDEEQGSIMTKIFFSNYITAACIVLVAYGKSSNLPTFFQLIHVFDGPYDDFSVPWYGNVGLYLMTTFILQSFSPLVANLFLYFIGKPVLRLYHHERVRELRSHAIVMQHDLNMLEVGDVFDCTDHTAQLLTLLFFAMTFSPGLPLLMPLCCFAFMLYFRVDKFLLCRYYQRPPHIGDAAMKVLIDLLPWAGIIRLGIACWMLGNPDILENTVSASTQSYQSNLDNLKKSWAGTFGRDRILQQNIFPLFILLIVSSAALIIIYFWKQLPIYWIFKFIYACFTNQQEIFRSNDGVITAWEIIKLNDPLRQQSAGYTQEYFRYIKHKDEIPDTCYQMFAYAYLTKLSEMEIEEGYMVEDRGDFVVKVKVYREEGKHVGDGSRAKRGDRKKTYEAVADHRCYSYDIEKVPAYKMAIQGLREGTASIMDYMQQQHTTDSKMDGSNASKLLFESAGIGSHVVADYERQKKNRHSFFNQDGAVDLHALEVGGHHATAAVVAEKAMLDAAIAKVTKTKPDGEEHHAPPVPTETAGKKTGMASFFPTGKNKIVAVSNVDTPSHEDHARPSSASPNKHKDTSPAAVAVAAPIPAPASKTNTKLAGHAAANAPKQNRNFTFDDFDNMAMEVVQQNNNTTTLGATTPPPPGDDDHDDDDHHEDGDKKKKKKKKHKKHEKH